MFILMMMIFNFMVFMALEKNTKMFALLLEIVDLLWLLKSFMLHWLNMKVFSKVKKLPQTTHLSLPITLKNIGNPLTPYLRVHSSAKVTTLKAPWTQLLIVGITILHSIQATPSLDPMWCVYFVTNLTTMPNIATKFEGIHLEHHKLIIPLQVAGLIPKIGWSTPEHHTSSPLTLITWALILNTRGMMISSLTMALVFQFLIQVLLLSFLQQPVFPYTTYFVFHPWKKKPGICFSIL